MKIGLLELKIADLFELDPNGFGSTCRKCRIHFPSTKDWHLHIATCAPELCTAPALTVPSKPTTQLEIADWLLRAEPES